MSDLPIYPYPSFSLSHEAPYHRWWPGRKTGPTEGTESYLGTTWEKKQTEYAKKNTTSHTQKQYKCRKRDIIHRQQHDTQLSYTNTYDEHLFDFKTSTPQLPKELGLITSFCKQPVPGVTCFGSRPLHISSPIPDCNLDQEVFLWNSTNLEYQVY